MPSRVTDLEHYYVHSATVGLDSDFTEYIAHYEFNWKNSPDALATWHKLNPQYSWSAFEPNDPEFWESRFVTCQRFFETPSDLREPFAAVSGMAGLPESFRPYLRIVHSNAAIPGIQKALQHVEPFEWEDGEDAMWLFGNQLWKLSSSELHLSRDELRLIFLDAIDSERRRFERLRAKFSGIASAKSESRRSKIPEDVRIFVWRRDEGRCAQCSSNQKLEFDHIIPLEKGGSDTERNLQLLCEPCNRSKGNRI